RERILPALDRSIEWTKKASSTRYFPIAGIDHARALASLERFREILSNSATAEAFDARVEREFQVYKSAGWDGRGGGVLFTGYCTPIMDGSRERTEVYKYPLYGLPPDLAKDKDGAILGRKAADGSLSDYPDRGTIESSGLLAGQGLELAWLKDPFDAYIAQVQGSVIVRMQDGSELRLGYAGNNGREYTSVRNELIRDGKLRDDEASLTSMRAWAAEHPKEASKYMARNERYVFFTPIEGNPRGSLNVEVTAERSLATDKTLFPRGAVTFVDTRLGGAGTRTGRSFSKFMLDQDTGGAIRTAGRADIYLGIGATAERQAGATKAEGQLYYLFLKA
ncbi:MAG TPA: MltA domain-containing protein, partial [Planctomycetota bacterium]|nr:MltA domain-containing protein [Planctomycetota bacterium]